MKKTVMTIEDSASLRQVIREILEEAGYNVIEARHGEAALTYLNGKSVHIILCDLNMPVMDGYEFLKILKTDPKYEAYKNVPVIILTTETDKLNKEKTKSLGAYGWISKPFDPISLRKIVDQHSGA